MSEIWQTAWAVARSGLLAQYNRGWRFSRSRVIAFALLFQVLAVVAVARRAGAMSGVREGMAVQGLATVMLLQMAWLGLVRGYARGQFQLFQGVLVPLFNASPARPIGFLIGRVLEGIPAWVWTAGLWGWAYSAAVRDGSRAPVFLALFALGIGAGLVANLAGLLTVTFVARVAPSGLMTGLFILFAGMLGLVTWAVIYLVGGGTVSDLALTLRQYRLPVYAVSGALLGAPGLGLLAAFFLWPERVEDFYRQGVFRVAEAQERGTGRPSRSRWLPLPDGPFRGILAKEWLMQVRSPFITVGWMLWGAVCVAAWFAAPAARGAGLQGAVLVVGSVAVFAWGLSFSGRVATAFSIETVTQMLYRLAAVPAGTLFMAKLVSLWLPSLVTVVVPALIGAWRAGLSPADTLALAGWSALAVTGGVVGGLGLAAASAGEEPDEPEAMAGARFAGAPQPSQSNPLWALARVLALVLPAAVAIWVGAGQPWTPVKMPLAGAVFWIAVLPLACCAIGIPLMVRGWRAPRTRIRPR